MRRTPSIALLEEGSDGVCFADVALRLPRILLPDFGIEDPRWSQWVTLACDQYTEFDQFDGYWGSLEAAYTRNDVLSTLFMMLPEVYLNRELDDIRDQRQSSCFDIMNTYLREGVFKELEPGFIYVERGLDDGTIRKGLLVDLDLEHYSFSTKTMIRPTEATIPNRVPPRLKIRMQAPLEMPHILVLIDDAKHRIIDPLGEKVRSAVEEQDQSVKKVYDFSFQVGPAGYRHTLAGWHIGQGGYLAEDIIQRLRVLKQLSIDAARERRKLAGEGETEEEEGEGEDKDDGLAFLYAMGDGNHSLLTAKAHWEGVGIIPEEDRHGMTWPGIKSKLTKNQQEDHVARYALVELLSMHDETIKKFHPIHRLIESIPDHPVVLEDVWDHLKKFFTNVRIVKVQDQGIPCPQDIPLKDQDPKPAEVFAKVIQQTMTDLKAEVAALVVQHQDDPLYNPPQLFPFAACDQVGVFVVSEPKLELEVGTLQEWLEIMITDLGYVPKNIEYFHDENFMLVAASHPEHLAITLPAVPKDMFFSYIDSHGSLPKKTFSIGRAQDKRTYNDCKLINTFRRQVHREKNGPLTLGNTASVANFVYDRPSVCYFGKNQVKLSLGRALQRENAKTVLLVYGQGSIKRDCVYGASLYDMIVGILAEEEIHHVELGGVRPNPDINQVRKGVAICRENDVDFILAVGGGSTIDAAKAISMGVNFGGDVWEIFLARRGASSLIDEVIPLGSVLTLAAAGSECNDVTALLDEDRTTKLNVHDGRLTPKFAIMDPMLTFTVSARNTLAGSCDILSHCFEQYFSQDNDSYITNVLLEGIMKVVFRYTPIAIAEPEDYESRSNLLWANTMALSGVSEAGKFGRGDWATHRMEQEVSAQFPLIKHGLGLAVITPEWMKFVAPRRPEAFVSLGTSVFGMTLYRGEDDVKFALRVVSRVEQIFVSWGAPTCFRQLAAEFCERNCIRAAERVVAHYGPNVGSYVKLTKEDMVAILMARISKAGASGKFYQ